LSFCAELPCPSSLRSTPQRLQIMASLLQERRARHLTGCWLCIIAQYRGLRIVFPYCCGLVKYFNRICDVVYASFSVYSVSPVQIFYCWVNAWELWSQFSRGGSVGDATSCCSTFRFAANVGHENTMFEFWKICQPYRYMLQVPEQKVYKKFLTLILFF
jgi:hypothetical protein